MLSRGLWRGRPEQQKPYPLFDPFFMGFYLYLFFSLGAILFLLVVIFAFGLPYFKGAPYATTTKTKARQAVSLLASRMKKGRVADLGSGDGRLVIALAQQGYRAHGYEINPFLIFFSRKRLKKYRLDNRAGISRKNYWREDLSGYQGIVVFGVFYIMPQLEEKLKQELKPGAVVISNYFQFPDWKPAEKKNGLYVYIR